MLILIFSFLLNAFADRTALPDPGGSAPATNDPEIRAACDAAWSQRALLVSSYGNCDAHKAIKGGGIPADPMCRSMPTKSGGTLSQAWGGGQCPKGSPSKPKYSQKGKRMSVAGKLVDPVPGGTTDCSGAWSGVQARLGRRMIPGKDLSAPTSTAEMIKHIPGQCFKEPKDGLLPGDTVVYNSGGKGHVFMIDRVAGGSGCEFSIFHSTGGDGNFDGPQIQLKGGEKGGSPVSDRTGATMNRLSRACVANAGPNVKVGRFDPKAPGCQGQVKEFKNEACADQCQDIGSISPEANSG